MEGYTCSPINFLLTHTRLTHTHSTTVTSLSFARLSLRVSSGTYVSEYRQTA